MASGETYDEREPSGILMQFTPGMDYFSFNFCFSFLFPFFLGRPQESPSIKMRRFQFLPVANRPQTSNARAQGVGKVSGGADGVWPRSAACLRT